jgi:hypothetical protein
VFRNCIGLGFDLNSIFILQYEINDCLAALSILNLTWTKMRALLKTAFETKKKLDAQDPWKLKVGAVAFSFA